MKQVQCLPRKIVFGKKSLSETDFSGKRLIVLHGRSTASEKGVDLIIKKLQQRHLIFDAYNFQTMDQITNFANEMMQKTVDVVVGIGGGSVIDKAKKVGGCLRQSTNLVDLIVVPTLPGSGVESSKAIVVNEPLKYIEADNKFLPDDVIYDFGLIAQAGLEVLVTETPSTESVASDESWLKELLLSLVAGIAVVSHLSLPLSAVTLKPLDAPVFSLDKTIE